MGAFSRIDYAVRLEEKLKNQGLDAFYFLHDDGLYKVRSGNFRNYEDARAMALNLRDRKVIEEFFIVSPQDYAVSRAPGTDCNDLREEIVRTANRFIGVPYQWGGESAEEGFDCSGLTMVVYRLNGLDLPRVSYHQFDSGRPVSGRELRKGDLVFFATRGPKRVSHVGIYLGGGRFIHAPRRGQNVKVSTLSSGYYASRFMGGRTYL
ncbi:MAG: hydrolase [Desulfuromonadaceae bacterium]|nr:hydrolase [Desulfuromonadaceae bacterium]